MHLACLTVGDSEMLGPRGPAINDKEGVGDFSGNARVVFSLFLGKIRFHLAIFFPAYLSSGISLIENIDRLFPRLRVIFSVRLVTVAPVPDARKQQEYYAKLKNPTPAGIPIVPIIMIHLTLLLLRPLRSLPEVRNCYVFG